MAQPAQITVKEGAQVWDAIFQHRQTVDANAEPAGRRHAVLQRGEEVLVQRLDLLDAGRGEAALLQAASLFETMMGLHKLLPIDPKPGTVPPS
mgnify:CR=1 FL=1